MGQRKADPDGPPPRKLSVCDGCGGSGLNNGSVDSPSLMSLPIELRELWQRQLEIRPEIYRSMDAVLAFRWRDRLDCNESLGEFMVACDEMWRLAMSEYAASQQMPTEERGRLIRQLLFRLLALGADIAWFLAIQGYPRRNSVGRLLREFAESDESDEDDNDPNDSDWRGG